MRKTTHELKKMLPGIIISSPDAAIYSVIDVRNIAKPGFNSRDFVLHCAREGKVDIYDKQMTLLVAPMEGFYNLEKGVRGTPEKSSNSFGEKNPGMTQMRIAYVLSPEEMALVPQLFMELFCNYEIMR